MNLEGLSVHASLEHAKRIVDAIEVLPPETIRGLSAHYPSMVFLGEEGNIVIARSQPHGNELVVKFPEGAGNRVVDGSVSSFAYRGTRYTVFQ
ncbi:MAG: hypothetical protein KKD18_01320 [Nanoarchaeota archaeon]|nr:hypothetical protein [Nanoarchaeota archaeon]MBU0977034.1 hypothetical protein [Nanoarchaeota archaeon]